MVYENYYSISPDILTEMAWENRTDPAQTAEIIW